MGFTLRVNGFHLEGKWGFTWRGNALENGRIQVVNWGFPWRGNGVSPGGETPKGEMVLMGFTWRGNGGSILVFDFYSFV